MSKGKVNIMDRLNTLRVFEAVCRLESHSRAAEEMNVTEGAVSKNIKSLESALGTRLFCKEGRRAVRNAEGEKLFSDISHAFSLLRQAERNLSVGLSEKPFVLAAPSTLLLRVIIPNALSLQAKIGQRSLQFVSDDTHSGPSNPRYDLAVRIGRLDEMPCQTVRLGKEAFGLVHSPRYRAPFLEDAECSKFVRLISADRPKIWDDWLRETDADLCGQYDSLFFDEMHHALQAAEAGLGAAIAPYPLAASAISEGRLIAPFGFHMREGAYCAVGDQTTTDRVDFRKICDALVDLLQA